jgi:transposase
VLSVEDWAEIRRLHRADGVPIKVIARSMGISKNTVRKALRADRTPRYERPAQGSVVDAVEPRIRELLQVTPTMPATVIAERIGWEHSIRTLRTRVSELPPPVYLPPDPAWRSPPHVRPPNLRTSGFGRLSRRRGVRRESAVSPAPCRCLRRAQCGRRGVSGVVAHDPLAATEQRFHLGRRCPKGYARAGRGHAPCLSFSWHEQRS